MTTKAFDWYVKRFDQAVADANVESIEDPFLRYRLLTSIGTTYEAMGLYEQAIAYLAPAMTLAPDLPELSDESTLQPLEMLTKCYVSANNLERGLQTSRRFVAKCKDLYGESDSKTLSAMLEHARYGGDVAELAIVMKRVEEQLGGQLRDLDGASDELLRAADRLTLAYSIIGNHDAAIELCDHWVSERVARQDQIPKAAIEALLGVAWVYRVAKQKEEGLTFAQQAFALGQEKLGPNHPTTFWAMMILARLYKANGQQQELAQFVEDQLRHVQERIGPFQLPLHEQKAWLENQKVKATTMSEAHGNASE